MRNRASTFLLGAVKLIAVVAGAAVVGAILGGGRHAFSGAPQTPPVAPGAQAQGPRSASATGSTTAARTARTSPSSPTTGGVVGQLDLGSDVTVRVVSAAFLPAETAAGRSRERGRLSVDVRVHNGSGERTRPPVSRLFIRAGGVTVRADRNATAAGAAALLPIDPGDTAAGELHFETAGALTRLLRDATMVNIRYGPQRVPTRIG